MWVGVGGGCVVGSKRCGGRTNCVVGSEMSVVGDEVCGGE